MGSSLVWSFTAVILLGCSTVPILGDDAGPHGDTDTDVDSDVDGDTDSDTDNDADTDSDADADTDGDSDSDTGTETSTDIPTEISWVSIPGGSFEMGSTAAEWEQPVHLVSVPSFEMTRTEVTVAQYGACVEADSCVVPGSGWLCNWGEPGYENHPVNFVSWDEAVAFCTWAGGRLPTESEWEYAATSAGQDIMYPWGNEEADCTYTVMEGIDGYGCGSGRTWEVCSRTIGNTAQGLCDMAGNVWEWVQDTWEWSYYDAPADGSAWEVEGHARVLRSGAFNMTAWDLRAASRTFYDPDYEYGYLGFRCARDAGGE